MTKLKPFQIGNIDISPPLVLAPMAGVTHSPFRQLVAKFGGCGLLFSEMLSARHLPNDIKKNSLWLHKTEVERPLAYQIVASTAEEAALGATHLETYSADIVDINMACPAPNIRKRKAGAFLLSDIRKIEEILTAVRNSISCPLTVKIRLGVKPDMSFLKDLAALFDDLVDAITIHPRLTTEKLKRHSRWEYIGHLKQMSNLPVIGNGDVKTREDCFKMLAETGCDGVMIGRAAVQKPWLFKEICQGDFDIDHHFLHETYTTFCKMLLDYFPKEMAIGRIKEFTWYFSKNLKFGHRFAAQLQSRKAVDDCLEFIEQNFCSE